MTYDAALRGCIEKDPNRVANALDMLQDSLRPEAGPELARALSEVYARCRQQIQAGDFEEPIRTLQELRDTWVKIKKQSAIQPPDSAD